MTKTDDRIFWALVGFAFALMAAALVFGALNVRRLHYETADTPEAALHNFVLAVNRGDYKRAYSLLADVPCKPPYDAFRNALGAPFTITDVEIRRKTVQDGRATLAVDVDIEWQQSSLFMESAVPETQQGTVELVHTRQGWRLKSWLPGFPLPPLDMPQPQCPRAGGD